MTSSPERTLPEVHEHTVAPAGGGTETRWLLLFSLVTIACCILVIYLRADTKVEKQLESWQINSFEALNSDELAVFNGLQTAALEIDLIHEMEGGRWPGIAEMEELFIPPFVRSAAWKKQGEIIWTQKVIAAEERHIALYLGTPQKDNIRGVFLLLMLHDHRKKQGNVAVGPQHAPFEIWLHDKTVQQYPQTITDQALISAGWREIIALTGEDEVKRMKGNSIP